MFCWKGRLSKKLRQRNFQVLSVDHKVHKGTTVLRIDISKRSDRKILEDILSMDCVLYCHFAPPCGTASAARHIKPGPPPLRSTAFPMGFKHLKGLNKRRVVAAFFLVCLDEKDDIAFAQRWGRLER